MVRRIAAISLLAAACSSGIDQKSEKPVVIIGGDMGMTEDSGGAEDSGTPDLGGPTSEPDGPMILDLSASPSRITEGGTVTFNALLSDPQGFADIGGGRLTDRDGNVVGLFSGSGGAYTFTVTWDTLHGIRPITFETGEERVFTAEFFDAADHRATQPIALSLHCDGAPACQGRCGAELCNGSCRDLSDFESDPQNCGSCGNACGLGICENSACLDCAPSEFGQQYICDPICQTGCNAGEDCVPDGDALDFFCGQGGNVGENQPCSAISDCRAGLFCGGIEGAADSVCLQPCDVDGANTCPNGLTCTPVGFADLGICDPGGG